MSHTIEALISTLQTPDIYPHSVSDTIDLVQTHISYVFLTGDYAYKLKKSVNFGFLDFSTLERRQQFCEAELNLNQALTKNMYLEVVPVTYDGTSYAFGGDGDVVEYAVKMRQFPQESLLSELFANGELTEGQMDQLGKTVADFHAIATTNDHIRSYGEIDKIRQAIDENYDQTGGYIGRAQTQERYDQTKEFTDNFFASREDIFASRRDQGKIKECHGDLHLRNICIWEDEIQLFDRIEFNEPFRFVDTMYDVAFAVMDLDARGAVEFGNAFLNTYLEETGDWEGLQVLPLYLSRQAYVRAKVTSFLLDDPAIPDDVKAGAAKDASDYYELAWKYTQRPEGKVVMMSGLSGSGKSTVARRCSRIWNAIHIRSDAVRKHLAGVPLHEKADDSVYTPEMTAKTYACLTELGVMLAKQGFTVILDAKFDRVDLRKDVIDACKVDGLAHQILYCQAPVSTLETRLNERTGDIADATADLLQSQVEKAEGFTEEESLLVRNIDTTQNIDAIISYL